MPGRDWNEEVAASHSVSHHWDYRQIMISRLLNWHIIVNLNNCTLNKVNYETAYGIECI